jgi:hypothetical protein
MHPDTNTNKAVAFDQRPRPLHKGHTQTDTYVRERPLHTAIINYETVM